MWEEGKPVSMCLRETGQILSTNCVPSLLGKEGSASHRIPRIEESSLEGVLPWHPAHLLKSVGFHPAPCPVLEMGRWFCNNLGCGSWERQEGSLPQSGGWAPGPVSIMGEEHTPVWFQMGTHTQATTEDSTSFSWVPGLDRVRQDRVS